jgi:hypothetical protein
MSRGGLEGSRGGGGGCYSGLVERYKVWRLSSGPGALLHTVRARRHSPNIKFHCFTAGEPCQCCLTSFWEPL